VLVVGKNIVQFDAERAPRELKALLKEPEHLIYTLIVPGGRVPAGNVVADVVRPELVFQRVEVASAEGRIGLPLPVLVWMRHLISPFESTCRTIVLLPHQVVKAPAWPRSGGIATPAEARIR
jgi:hypothetical protein